MKYLIKSIKWTKHSGEETWYRPDSHGYTTSIAEAGIYTEEDKNDMSGITGEKVIAFIPLTQKLINKGKKQLKMNMISLENHLIVIKERYERNKLETEKDISRIIETGKKLSKLQEFVLIEVEGLK